MSSERATSAAETPEAPGAAASPPAIECSGLSKAYLMADSPWQRLMQQLRGRSSGRLHWALQDVNLCVGRGEVVGVVGRNGAGKSTLLQLLCGTLAPTSGSLAVRGRVAALLELGAGFNPQFTGRENALLNAALLGLSPEQARAKLQEMLAFADIGEFVDQPVRTYSSGMFVRLAFSVATSFEPDILVIDEALSVGDGAFARKSFERIMQLRDRGATILFCSHSMYQVEALCERAVWLDGGRVRLLGSASEVCGAYQAHLNGLDRPDWFAGASALGADGTGPTTVADAVNPVIAAGHGTARLTGFTVSVAGHQHGTQEAGTQARVRSGLDDVVLTWYFASDPALPAPTVAFGISDENGLTISSGLSISDGARLERAPDGSGRVSMALTRLPLLKGRYWLTAFLLSEDGVHVYDQAIRAAHITVEQEGPMQGFVNLPRRWL
jgi:lipopolysaccharide transport system ATP-binding protein